MTACHEQCMCVHPIPSVWACNPSAHVCFGIGCAHVSQSLHRVRVACAHVLGRPRLPAQVTNTPWGERVQFVFTPAGEQVKKCLHVSPFMDMESTW